MNGEKILTVSQLSRYLKSLLQSDEILQNICVSGEISNFKLHRPSGHIYFTLKDRKSVLRCIFFRSRNLRLKFQPGEGMKVLAWGNISIYEYGGYYQLYVNRMEPDGLGTLFLAFEQLKEKLRLEGLFDPKHKKPLPFIPRKIGLITSPSGAALQDFLRTLLRRFPCVQVLFCPSAV
ncbi:MAG: exodeoxyribonuclease VII large subunit, partial [Dethiobacteria bacterium]